MANENIKKLNGLTITVGSKQRRFSTSTTDRTNDSAITPDAEEDPRPKPQRPEAGDLIYPNHNSDEHHHHDHNHEECPDGFEFDENLQLCVEEELDDAPDPGEDLIDIFTFQSEIFYTNKITILEGTGNKVLQIKNIGVGGQEQTLDTIERMGELLQQFPNQDNNSVLNLAIHPYYRDLENQLTLIGVGPHDVPTRLSFIPENILDNVDGDSLMSLPFPTYVEEFDVASPSTVLNEDDSKVWGDVGRPDIGVFIEAYLFAQLGDYISSEEVLDIFYNNGGYKFSDVHSDLYNRHILGGEVLPSINGNTSLLEQLSYYTNILGTNYYFELKIPNEGGLQTGTFNIPRLKFKLVGPQVAYQDIEEFKIPEEPEPVVFGCMDIQADNYNPNANVDDGSCEYLGCTDPLAINYDETANVDDGTCEYDDVFQEGIDEDDPINNVLIDDYSTDEEISDNFGVPGVSIEQTVLNSFNPYSGLDIDTNVFQNTQESLINSDNDGRIPLGMFSFDEDNVLQDNFPDLFRDEKFVQIPKQNLVRNGDGKSVKSIFKNKTPMGNNKRERFFIPAGGWGYCTYDGVGVQMRTGSLYRGGDGRMYNDGTSDPADDYPYNDNGERKLYGAPIANTTNGQDLIDSFQQSEVGGYNDEGGTIDSQGAIGYAGYYPYFFDYRIGRNDSNSLLRLQHNFITASDMTDGEADICNKFFMQNQVDSLAKSLTQNGIEDAGGMDSVSTFASQITPYRCTAVGKEDPSSQSGGEANTYFPNFAKWIIDTDFTETGVSCYSNNRCLEFLGTNFYSGSFILNDDGEEDSHLNTFSWDKDNDMNVANGGVTKNQYRSLNQVIKIYNPYRDTVINPFAVMEVKFKMKTWSKLVDLENLPQVEIALQDGDGAVMPPDRIYDRYDEGDDLLDPSDDDYGRNLPYSTLFGYWPHGDFNSTRYSDDINDVGTLNRKYSNFGAMGRFQNTEADIWETFSYKFTMGQVFRFNSGIIRPLFLLIQAANEFYGRVWIDDIEVYESGDFIPDVDVRKKISSNKYGKGDLTKYYDKKLQPEEYKDSQGPLEAQFYFYPQHPSDEVFDQKRTPVYQDFKKGRFYIYDVNWGDGTPNEFTSEPEPIDEEIALYHTYETSGVFEVTGMMIRTKVDESDKQFGIIKNKKFRLTININEGLDEDFKYFGSDGFSFIPYKNHSPIIGGYSNQSLYYKTIKRQLGFIDLGDGQTEQTYIEYANDGDRLKTQIALDEMDSSLSENLDLLNEYKRKRYDVQPLISHNFKNVNNLQWTDYSSGTVEYENGYLKMTNDGTDHWLGMMENTFTVQYGKTYQIDAEIYVPLDWDGGHLLVGDGASFGYWEPDGNLQQIPETYNITTDLGIRDEFQPVRTTITIPEEDEFNYNNDLIGKYYVRVQSGNPSAGKFIYLDNFTIRQLNLDNLDEVIYNGIETYPSELGKSIGDTDVTNIKFYNKAMNIVELLGFQCDEFSEINIIPLNNPQNGANYHNHSESFPDTKPSDVQTGLELPEGTSGNTLTLITDTDNPTAHDMRVGYRFRVNNEDDIQYVDAGNSNLKVSTPYLKAGKTYTFSTHIYIPDGFESQGNENQIQLGVIQTPADNDWAANANFLESNYCCTENDFLNNLCEYEGEDDDDKISYGSSRAWSYYAGCFYNDFGTMSSMGETPKGMTYITLDTAPVDENNQWHRMSGTFTPLNPDEYGDYLSFRIMPYGIGYGGSTDDIYFMFGAQLEEGDTMSPYTTEDIDFGDCLRYDANIPDNPRYWKNIIPENYSIYNREGIDLELTPPVDIYVEQEWLDDSYYYPVLPNYGLDGQFIEGNLTNNKIPFPLEAAITNETEVNKNLLINITSEKLEANVFNDNSGNQNLGFGVVDYKPEFDNETFKPKKKKNIDLIKSSTNNGAF